MAGTISFQGPDRRGAHGVGFAGAFAAGIAGGRVAEGTAKESPSPAV